MPPSATNDFRRDLELVQQTVRSGVTAQRTTSHDNHWTRWVDYCNQHHIDPHLRQYQDPIPVIQVFAHRYRDGRLAPSGRTVKSRTVEDVVRAIAQKLTSMGSKDPRLNAFGKIDFRLTRQFQSYKRVDAPPIRVKPVPVTLLLHILRHAHGPTGTDSSRIHADLIVVAFYFLLRPGEYTGTSAVDQPFLLQDVRLHLGPRALDTLTSPLAELQAATAVSYTLTRQKNGVGNETLNHGRANHPLCCPVRASIRLLVYHRLHRSLGTTPLASYLRNNRRVRVLSTDVTAILKSAAAATFHITGLQASEISARSLRAGGAMALLCAGVNCNVIQMLGRWHSDSMIRYLHVQAQPITNRLSTRMFNDGQYTFLPSDTVPANAP